MQLPDLAAIHDRYLAFAGAGRSPRDVHPAGALLLRSEFDPALIVAASIAGAASLSIDADGESLRAGLRRGFCDFVVGHLDEAIRILKNELRQRRAVSVGLTAAPEACLTEIVERGLQPDLLSLGAQEYAPAQILFERGALAIPASSPLPGTALMEWSVTNDPARSLRAIARIACGVLDPLRADTPARCRWLESSPAWLSRTLGPRQCVRLTEKELAAFLPSLWSQFPGTTLTRDGTQIRRG